METYITGTAPATTWHYKGPLAEIRALSGPDGSLGHPTDSRLELRYRNGAWEALENGLVDLDTGAEHAPDSIMAPSIRTTRFKGTGGYKTAGASGNSTSTLIAGRTSLLEQIQALGPFTGYKITVWNHDPTAKVLALLKSTSVPTAGHDGTTLTWTTQKINGTNIADVSVPGASYADAANEDVDMFPGYVDCDFVQSVDTPRTDVLYASPLQQVRSLYNNGCRPLSALGADWRARTGLSDMKSAWGNYDAVTNPSYFGMVPASSGVTSLYQTISVDFAYKSPTLKMGLGGDSVMAGYATASNSYSFLDHAAMLQRTTQPGTILVPVKYASAGRKMGGTLFTLQSLITAGKIPESWIVPSFSINNGADRNGLAIGWSNAMKMLDLCFANGITPILLTPAPYYNFASIDQPYWVDQRMQVLELGRRITVCDLFKDVADLKTGGWLTGASGDGSHFNDASTPLAGARFFEAIRGML